MSLLRLAEHERHTGVDGLQLAVSVLAPALHAGNLRGAVGVLAGHFLQQRVGGVCVGGQRRI